MARVATYRIAKAYSVVAAAREDRRHLVRPGKAARDARRQAARLERHLVHEALRARDYLALEEVA
jgi:hypothetical protein